MTFEITTPTHEWKSTVPALLILDCRPQFYRSNPNGVQQSQRYHMDIMEHEAVFALNN